MAVEFIQKGDEGWIVASNNTEMLETVDKCVGCPAKKRQEGITCTGMDREDGVAKASSSGEVKLDSEELSKLAKCAPFKPHVVPKAWKGRPATEIQPRRSKSDQPDTAQ